MKISSNSRDYYDSVMALGADESLHYIRRPREVFLAKQSYKGIDNPKLKFMESKSHFWISATFQWLHLEIEETYVMFCGKLYSYLLMTVNSYKDHKTYTRALKSSNALLDVLSYHGIDEERFLNKTHPYKYQAKAARSFFNNLNARAQGDVQPISHELFFEHGTPLFTFVRNKNNRRGIEYSIIADGILKDVEFQSILDPFQTYQEISMFLGGVLGEAHPPMLSISDEDMKASKGFGHKYAFKKEPTKRKAIYD